MLRVNPVLEEREWVEKVQDWLHAEEAEIRKKKQAEGREEERKAIEELRQQAIQQRVREVQAQALVQNQRPEFVEQNLWQWIRRIEEDERVSMVSPTERRTRERSREIQDHRRLLERDGRFRGIVEDIRRLPNGPERQEVFRRFGANLYTQEYPDPLAREGAELLALSTAALRELEALEDEERRETGGRELVRPLTLIMEDGSQAGWVSASRENWYARSQAGRYVCIYG
jgi:hypothetical protein